MTIEVDVPFSPGWWLLKCSRKLDARQKRLKLLNDRLEGNARLPDPPEGVDPERYRSARRKSRTNFADLIVEARRSRMNLLLFRSAQAVDGDDDANRIWTENSMEVEFPEILTNMLGLGDGYAIVGNDDRPVITSEDPRQVVTIHDPVRQRNVRSAAKIFHDDDFDLDLAYLYLPPEEPKSEARRWVAVRERRARTAGVQFNPSSWSWDEEKGGSEGEEIGISRVPVVRFRNRRGIGEFERHVDLLDRLDDRVFEQRMITSMQAFRQMAIEGTLPDVDDKGNEIDWNEVFRSGPDALWRLPDGIKLWESQVTDITPVLTADDKDLRKLAAVSMTPLHVFSPEVAGGSAEGAALVKEMGIAAAKDRIIRASEGARDVMSLAFEYLNDTARSDRTSIQPVWYPPEMRSLAEMADADSKSTLPFGTKLSKIYGLTAQEMKIAEEERATDTLMSGVANAPAQ